MARAECRLLRRFAPRIDRHSSAALLISLSLRYQGAACPPRPRCTRRPSRNLLPTRSISNRCRWSTGFREYDARWLFEKEINLMGAQALGLGLATLLNELGVKP